MEQKWKTDGLSYTLRSWSFLCNFQLVWISFSLRSVAFFMFLWFLYFPARYSVWKCIFTASLEYVKSFEAKNSPKKSEQVQKKFEKSKSCPTPAKNYYKKSEGKKNPLNMNKNCSRCNKIVYPIEELKCLDKVNSQ